MMSIIVILGIITIAIISKAALDNRNGSFIAATVFLIAFAVMLFVLKTA